MKCLWDGELPTRRKAKVCGPCSASRFIRQKANKEYLLSSFTLAICELKGKEVFFMSTKKRSSRAFKSVKVLTLSAMLTAISVVVAFVCKVIPFLNFGIGLRITFENLPIIMAGILFGPIVGGCVGLATDIISCMISGMTPIPLVTIGATSIGVVAGIVSNCFMKNRRKTNIICSVVASHTIGSLIIKSLGLWGYYYAWGGAGVTLLFRIPIYIVVGIVETVLLCILLRNSAIRKAVDR